MGTRPLSQAELDRAVRTLREGDAPEGSLPKGRSAQTAILVAEALHASTSDRSIARSRRNWAFRGRRRNGTWATWRPTGELRSLCGTAQLAGPSIASRGAARTSVESTDVVCEAVTT